MPQALVLLFS
ncbi:hypothetical protein Taro_038007, partial [Colocasia esculenta]|nr:hypothetical protein [Colocasia esculenta]